MEVTEDTDFLVKYGAEILFETARLWASLGSFIEGKGFCINCVTGPDEYTALVDNNCYTNLMARENLQYAYDVALWMQRQAGDAYRKLAASISLDEQELVQWKRAADHMYIPYDDQRQIHKQDDTFLEKAIWDFEHTPPENYPLLIHYHPLVIYRYQVCKQADLVLAMFLLGHKFTREQIRRNYDYYEKVTTHDSSLSTCIFSIVASEIGYHDRAYEYFMNTARMDLDDTHHNVNAGIHAANMAGTWMCLVNGFAGMRTHGDVLSFRPALPKGWQEYTFKITYRGRLLRVTVSKASVTYELVKGDNLAFVHDDQPLILSRQGEVIDCARSDPAPN
jgi:alpha,alpha-trehalose phosphorylase